MSLYLSSFIYSLTKLTSFLSWEVWFKVFFTMFKNMILIHFYNSNTSHICNYDFHKIIEYIWNFFEDSDFQQKNLNEWNKIILFSIIIKNLNKSMSECIQLLIIQLQQLQHDLQEALHNDIFLHNKIVISCQEISTCRYAMTNSFSEINSLINKLQSFIMIYKKEHSILTHSYYMNHHYH